MWDASELVTLSGLSLTLKTKKMLFVKHLLKCHHKEKSTSVLKKCCNSLLCSSQVLQMEFALFASQEMHCRDVHRSGASEGKNKSLRSERKLGQKMQQIVCKRMIQAALIWICSLAKTRCWRSSLSVSGDDKRQRGKVTGLRRIVAAAAPWK